MTSDKTKAADTNETGMDISDIFQLSEREKKHVLHIRAKELAAETESKEKTTGSIDVVEFDLAHERYGIESKYVKEVFPLTDLTPIPCTPPFIMGITVIRGQIVPVTDIKRFFNLPSTGITNLNRLMIIRDDEMTLGILADSIESVRELDEDAIHDRPGTLSDLRNDYLKGVTKDHLIILDGKKILSDTKIRVNEEV